MRALKELGWPKQIPVDMIEADDHHAREIALAANVARPDLSPADESEAFTALHKGGLDAEKLPPALAPQKSLCANASPLAPCPSPSSTRCGQAPLMWMWRKPSPSTPRPSGNWRCLARAQT